MSVGESIMDQRYEGVVRWFNPEKGYGFTDCEEVGQVFVHYKSIEMDGFKQVATGDLIEFGLRQGEKGWQAVETTVLSKAAAGVRENNRVHRFIVPAADPVGAALAIRNHYRDDDELTELIDELLVVSR